MKWRWDRVCWEPIGGGYVWCVGVGYEDGVLYLMLFTRFLGIRVGGRNEG